MRQKVVSVLLAAAVCVGAFSGCGSGGSSSETADGGTELQGIAECTVADQNISYPIYLKIIVDENGAIVSVEDDGTEVPDGKDGKYKEAQAIFENLKGKTKDTLGEVDAVSGATDSSNAILEAVSEALG